MKSNSETSYGARIGNAEKLVATVQNFNGYVAIKPVYSSAAYSVLIAEIKNQNFAVATKKQDYSLAVTNRKLIFETSDTSIKKLLSPINGAVKVIFGKTAKESTDIAAIIAKIRGANGRKSKTKKEDEESVSQSYQSYNSKAQFFIDLIAYLTNFGVDYAPANNNVTILNLNKVYNDAIDANNKVRDSFTKFIKVNESRIASYNQLAQNAQGIKDSIKSQYGYNSVEYNLIKGLKI